MGNDDFMKLLCNKDVEKTVVIADLYNGIEGVSLNVSFLSEKEE